MKSGVEIGVGHGEWNVECEERRLNRKVAVIEEGREWSVEIWMESRVGSAKWRV